MQKLSDSPAIRWTALVLLASAMFFAYIFVDVLSPLQGLLQTQRGWDPDAYGHFAGSEPFLNVFVFFLIFAGIILDKMGVRFTAVLSGVVMVLGAAINWYAVTDLFDASSAKTFMDNTLNLPQAWWNVTPWYDGMPASSQALSHRLHDLRLRRRDGRHHRQPWYRQVVHRPRNGTRHGHRDGHSPYRRSSRNARLTLPGFHQSHQRQPIPCSSLSAPRLPSASSASSLTASWTRSSTHRVPKKKRTIPSRCQTSARFSRSACSG